MNKHLTLKNITSSLKDCYIIKTVTIVLIIGFSILFTTLPPKSLAEDTEIIDIVTELYKNYESIDRDLTELEGVITRTDDRSLFTPFSVGVKKKTDIEFISIEVDSNGMPLANHIYNDRDNNALNLGGRHLLFKGKIATGKHKFVLHYLYKDKSKIKEAIKSKASWSMGVSNKPTHIELVFVEEDGKIKVKPKKMIEGH